MIGFALRMLLAWEISTRVNAVYSPMHTTDLATYMKLSREIVNGTFEGAFYYQPFYYAAFLPAVMLIFGQSVWSVITVQALLGGLTIFFAAWGAKILFNEKSGIVTALLIMFANVLIFYTPFHKIATLQTFLVTMFTFFLIKAFTDEKERFRYWIWAGAFLGMGCAARGNLYIMLTGIIPLLLWMFPLKKAVCRLGFVLLMTVVMQLPFIIYNSVQEGRLCGSSTASSAVLALGNTPESPPGGLEYPESYQIFMAKEKERSVPLQILDYLFAEPLAYLELTFRKVILFYDSEDISNNVIYPLHGGKYLHNNIFGWVGWILILCIGGILSNIVKAFKERDFGKLVLISNIIFYGLSISMFYNLARFRAPILPSMAVMGGIFAVQCYEKARAKEFKSIILPLIFGIFIAVFLFDAYRYYEKYIMRLVRPDGTHIVTLNGKKAVFDNGPAYFGGGSAIIVKEGDVFEKVFADVPPDAQGLLSVPTVFNAVLLEVNGRRLLWKKDTKNKKIEIPCKLNEGKASVKILRLNADEPYMFVDTQRDYGRSLLNGEVLDSEWQMRFYY